LFGDEAGSLAALRNGTVGDTVVLLAFDGETQPYFGAYHSAGDRTLISAHDNTYVQKWLPHNCVACHGGSGAVTYNDSTWGPSTSAGRASLLPFDPFAYSFNPSPYSYADQVEAFRMLNAMVVQSNATAGVKDFINGTYPGGVGVVGSQPDPNYIPAGWKTTPGDRMAYNKVIKPYCRTCHMTQEPANGGTDFLNAVDAEALRPLVVMDVCKTHSMPHAQQTMKNFWASGARAHLLGFFGRHDYDGELCTP
jgi:mono/diheme cytochrome c family protein